MAFSRMDYPACRVEDPPTGGEMPAIGAEQRHMAPDAGYGVHKKAMDLLTGRHLPLKSSPTN
jgi:hypothetical protein